MYNNTISGTATEKGGNDNKLLCQRYYYCTCSIYCNYIIITSFFSCCARDSIIVHVVLYCKYIIITSFFSCWTLLPCSFASMIINFPLSIWAKHNFITPFISPNILGLFYAANFYFTHYLCVAVPEILLLYM
jgi:hypothetical protein